MSTSPLKPQPQLTPVRTPVPPPAVAETPEKSGSVLATPIDGDKVDGDGADLFDDMKKKKKKKKEIPLDLVSLQSIAAAV